MKPSVSETKPYEMIGAGRLSSALYKLGDEKTAWRYRFNIYRTDFSSGRLSHWLQPDDLIDVLKLVQVIASELAYDGCLDDAQRDKLYWIAKCLEAINCETYEPTSRNRSSK
ncbi:MAG: hypothetical protein IT422_29670 [Pirellulaceae bacterium]|nr:hypothetical protein [Pirellulaceae bacterium]